jgi:hypothetical protein
MAADGSYTAARIFDTLGAAGLTRHPDMPGGQRGI